jgi:2-phosphosulfolactate phosphatase
MRVDVALTPTDARAAPLCGRTALVVDVLRATSTAVAACLAGCRRIIPVADEAAARTAASEFARDEIILAGERGGDPIAGFDLGNSPLEATADRVRGRTIILTTTNGTASMRAASEALAAAAVALTNVSAGARWAVAEGHDVTVLCAGDNGALSLEDAVCAGLVVERMITRVRGLQLSGGAELAWRLGQYYEGRLGLVAVHSRWARRLAGKGRSADVNACLQLDTTALVPVLEAGALVPGRVAAEAVPSAAAGGQAAP